MKNFLKIGLKFKDYEDDNKVLLYMKKFNIHNLKQLYYKFATNELSIETFLYLNTLFQKRKLL